MKTKLTKTLVYSENEKIFSIKEVEYITFWFLEPHCEKAKKVYQVDGKIGYLCKHEVKE